MSEKTRTRLTPVGTVGVPVTDHDRALEFYVDKLGFEKRLDVPFGDGERWIEVAPPGAATTIALVSPSATPTATTSRPSATRASRKPDSFRELEGTATAVASNPPRRSRVRSHSAFDEPPRRGKDGTFRVGHEMTTCVCVVNATSAPLSSRTSVWMTMVRRPT